MTQRWNTLAHVIAFMALTPAFGCKSSEAEFPKGTYAAVSLSDEQWEVVFADQGRFRVTRNGKAAVEGQYASTTDRVVLSNETGPDSCGEESGTYTWKRDGDILTLMAVEELCDGRRNVMRRLITRK